MTGLITETVHTLPVGGADASTSENQPDKVQGSVSEGPIRNGSITSGAQAIVWSLESLGVSDIFGIPGGNVIPLYNALMDSTEIRHILVRHEQGGGHAAAGYAAATGKVGVMVATSGPGATNLITAIADAHFRSLPMLIVTGQVSSKLMGTDAFQEADIIGMTASITKHSFLVTTAEDIAPTLAEAHLIASTGRPGPVLVDITKDAQQATTEFHWPPEPKLPGYKPRTKVHQRQIESAVQLILEANQPVLLTGGGVITAEATAQLRKFVQLADIPVVTTPDARGAFPESDGHHHGVLGEHGSPSAQTTLRDSDLIIAIGTSLNEHSTRIQLAKPAVKLIHADIDPAEVGRVRAADLSIVGDAKHVLHALTENLAYRQQNAPVPLPRPSTAERLQKQPPGRYLEAGLLNPQYVLGRIGALTGPSGVYAAGAGQHQKSAAHLQCNQPRSWLNSSAPGYSLPAAMGAKVARPDRTVWAIDSADQFQMTNQELATCMVNHIPIKVAILNSTPRRKAATGPEPVHAAAPPDFVKLAEAFGALAVRVTKAGEVEEAIKVALDTNDRAVVIEFAVGVSDGPLQTGAGTSTRKRPNRRGRHHRRPVTIGRAL
jgi:acetolactate synthase-1/2/3 large subunit